MTVELIYESDCPHAQAARANLLRAFSKMKLPAEWTEWEGSSPSTPAHALGFGSPTLLVNGRDVAGEVPQTVMSCCRLYVSPEGKQAGAPSVELIQRALQGEPVRWSRSFAVAPGIGVALLPKLLCPLCWPAYAGLVTTLGMGFLISERYLFWVTALFLLAAVGALAFRAEQRRGYGPSLLGLTGTAAVLMCKFALDAKPGVYYGLVLLITASLWNSWPRSAASSCLQCAPANSTFDKAQRKRNNHGTETHD
jgi:mercuric ion transport protein